MNNELETQPNETETWGYYKSLTKGVEKDEIGTDWVEAGNLGEYNLDDEESLNSLHALVNSFTNKLRDSEERPFQFILVPAMTKTNPENPSSSMTLALIEPIIDDIKMKELREFADGVRIN